MTRAPSPTSTVTSPTHGRALERYAFVLTGDPAAAQDLVQTALMKAYRRWRRVSAVEHPDAYVRKIVTNCLPGSAPAAGSSDPVAELPEHLTDGLRSTAGRRPGRSDRQPGRDRPRVDSRCRPTNGPSSCCAISSAWTTRRSPPNWAAARATVRSHASPGSATGCATRSAAKRHRHRPGGNRHDRLDEQLPAALAELCRRRPARPRPGCPGPRRRAPAAAVDPGPIAAVLAVAVVLAGVWVSRPDSPATPGRRAAGRLLPPLQTGPLPEWARAGFSSPDGQPVRAQRRRHHGGDGVRQPAASHPRTRTAATRSSGWPGRPPLPTDTLVDPWDARGQRRRRLGGPRHRARAVVCRDARARVLASGPDLGRHTGHDEPAGVRRPTSDAAADGPHRAHRPGRFACMDSRYRIASRPVAEPAAVVQGDRFRITVLTDGLLRLEYSDDGVFEDRASAFALFRDLPVPDFRVVETASRAGDPDRPSPPDLRPGGRSAPAG